MATILITGGTGLIGTAVTNALLAEGHVVHHLGRKEHQSGPAAHFQWDVAKGFIDTKCLRGVTHIIHLAGAGIAARRWTDSRVRELIESRATSAQLLLRAAKETETPIASFVSAAGISYYGACTVEHHFAESDPAGSDTIARISVAWEVAVDEWSALTRVVKLRTPMVLARSGGALQQLAVPVRLGAGAALGSGRQWVPWVHLDDLVRIYRAALFDERYQGVFNVNTGHDVTNDELMRTLARVLHRPYFLPRVPSFALRLALGELSSILLEGSRARNEGLLAQGFTFKHQQLEPALRDLLC